MRLKAPCYAKGTLWDSSHFFCCPVKALWKVNRKSRVYKNKTSFGFPSFFILILQWVCYPAHAQRRVRGQLSFRWSNGFALPSFYFSLRFSCNLNGYNKITLNQDITICLGHVGPHNLIHWRQNRLGRRKKSSADLLFSKIKLKK